MTSTRDRRASLRKLLLQGRGETQASLRDLLAERGFAATQSTVSRDLKLLGAHRRVSDDGHFVYRLSGAGSADFPAEMITDVTHNETMIVIRTRVGRAQAVGLEIDRLHHAQVLGTIAGDDTVLVIPTATRNVAALAASFRELSELEPPRR